MKADKDDLDQQELERKLAALPQPAPSAALDAAILAAVQADLAAAPAPVVHPGRPAANDTPATPSAAQPLARKRWTRWQLPLGLAASFVLSLSVVLKLQEHEAQIAAPQPAAAPVPAPMPVPVPAPAPAPIVADTESAAPAAQDAPAEKDQQKRRAIQPAKPGRAAAPAQAAPDDSERAAPPPPNAEDLAAREFRSAPQAVPELKLAPPAALALPARPAPSFGAPPPAAGGAMEERRVQITGSRIMSPRQDAVSPEAWLAAIDEMLKAGLRRDALAEWPRFRQAYPNYPVPQELLERLQVPKD
ncbi:hypothetical protein [Massilia sp. YIM B04103]|uniref:hypothetical protein n=1 Tax=Massilia sp. YIM B04103 TaxID=2963106 RepID=UPI00210D37AE|nr:hypothetical protein [Massilia sp. YIM B04103]